MKQVEAQCEPMATQACGHLDAVERRLLRQPSRGEIDEIQRELALVVALVRGMPVPVREPVVVEQTFRPIQRRLSRLAALLEQALAFCDGWQSILKMEAGYNPAGAWNEAPPVRGLLDHRG